VDRQDFLKTLAEASLKTGWQVHEAAGMESDGTGPSAQERSRQTGHRGAKRRCRSKALPGA